MAFSANLVEPGLTLSGVPEVPLDWLQAYDAVVNVCDMGVPEYLSALAPMARFVCRPFEDSLPAPLAFVRVATLELADCRAQGLNTLIHCQAGQSRSPAVIILYWMGRDGISWNDASRRIRASRPRVDPHPLLIRPSVQARVAEDVRAFLAGQSSLLDEARADADALLAADHARGAYLPPGPRDWDIIERGLGCGSRPCTTEEYTRLGFERVLDLTARENRIRLEPPEIEVIACGLPEDEPIDPIACQLAVDQVRQWRQAGRSVLVCCNDGKTLSPLIIALTLMAEHGWDFAGAMWYVRQRRQGAWPRSQSMALLGIRR